MRNNKYISVCFKWCIRKSEPLRFSGFFSEQSDNEIMTKLLIKSPVFFNKIAPIHVNKPFNPIFPFGRTPSKTPPKTPWKEEVCPKIMLTLLINYDIIVNIILINYVRTICGMMMFPLTQNVAVLVRSLYGYWNAFLSAIVIRDSAFLYARYMGIETF